MASPAAIHPRIAARSVRLLLDSGALLISAGGMVIVHTAARAPACALVAFLIFLLGVSLVALALAVTTQQQIEGSALPSAVAAFANHMRAARHVRLIRPQLLIAGTAALLVTAAGSFIVAAAANRSAAGVDGLRALFLAAFVIFLLGVWLALLSLVIMDRVPEPEAEIGSVAIA